MRMLDNLKWLVKIITFCWNCPNNLNTPSYFYFSLIRVKQKFTPYLITTALIIHTCVIPLKPTILREGCSRNSLSSSIVEGLGWGIIGARVDWVGRLWAYMVVFLMVWTPSLRGRNYLFRWNLHSPWRCCFLVTTISKK